MISKYRKYWNADWKIFDYLGFMSPNMWTMTHLIITIFSAIKYYQGDFFLGGILFAIGSFTDLIDGSVAKHFNKTSKFGAIFDATVDRICEGMVFIALARYFYVSVFAMACSFIVSYVRAKDDRIKIGVAESGERAILLFLASIFNFVEMGLYIIAILAGITALMRLNKAKELNS